jgi:hypothetical protein
MEKKGFKTWIATMVLAFGVIFVGCASNIESRKVNVDIDLPSNQLLKLDDCSVILPDNEKFKTDTGIARKIMENGFMKRNGDDYGYYYIVLNSRDDAFNWLGIPFVNLIAIPFGFLGLPMSYATYYISAEMIIFNSQGNMVKVYKQSKSFDYNYGFYYGSQDGLNNTASNHYSGLLSEVQNAVQPDVIGINKNLEASGKNTDATKETASKNIQLYLLGRTPK